MKIYQNGVKSVASKYLLYFTSFELEYIITTGYLIKQVAI